MNKNNVAIKILEHPDKDEIISKLVSNIPIADIHEWLEAKYSGVGEQKFVLSDKVISAFQKDYLDIYNIIRDDLAKTKTPALTPEEQLVLEVQGNPAYNKALNRYINNEVDIKIMIKRVVAAIETRAEQIFDLIQEDPRNIKMDRTLIEWFNTLSTLMEKYDMIQTGPVDQINIQNNINIQVVDEHINVIYNIIKEVLSKLDYDTSLLFIDMFNEEMKKLKAKAEEVQIPVETRLADAKVLSETISAKLDK